MLCSSVHWEEEEDCDLIPDLEHFSRSQGGFLGSADPEVSQFSRGRWSGGNR